MAFTDTWNYIQAHLKPGDSVQNWTKNKGYLGDAFAIHGVTPSVVIVDTPGAVNLQAVPKTDFEAVYAIWREYVACTFPRHRIRDEITRFSKHIISILHWISEENGGDLP